MGLNLSKQTLLIPDKGLKTLNFEVFGIGSVGSNFVRSLAKSGFTSIKVYDFDIVEEDNIPAQSYYLSHIGMQKTDALKELIKNETGTTYNLILTDQGKFLTCTNASAIAITVPTNASIAFPIGTIIGFQQGGAGQLTFSGAVPPTLKSADDAYTTVKLYSVCCIIKIDTDVWSLGGDLEA